MILSGSKYDVSESCGTKSFFNLNYHVPRVIIHLKYDFEKYSE